MLFAFLFVLSAGPTGPTWDPATPPPPQTRLDFKDALKVLPEDMRPTDELDMNCSWASYLIGFAVKALEVVPTNSTARAIHDQASRYFDENCRGPGAKAFRERHIRVIFYLAQKAAGSKMPQARELTAPFQLPPLPDRVGGDLGVPLFPMFLALEARLAAAGHALSGSARACAWASAALSAAQAVQRTPGATTGIAAGARTLETQQTTHCQGSALAQKEAAWAWLRAHPGITQPLVVPLRPPVGIWPDFGPADGALWFATAVLVLAPEAWPALLVAAPGH